MESKTNFIKQQLAEKGIYDYTEEDIKFLKIEMIDAMHYGKKDKYEAFEDAFYIWKRRRRNERDKV
ncbi:hypothetical protein [Hydrogenivirga sp. 128-5-R1-1]|uniref:hypothetical protein n=1 Tax=Hydrogenivirga sp. 128-5-R1-1 TaxID=392423 RepID=UPI00015F0310|nr:hypothetical protein [Hydrogenivirga sp. 128-5-R1-1]EDP73570.1 hypothetical protein HG1285_07769 [Hydrogenivirga sp. 128-5-R1-1]